MRFWAFALSLLAAVLWWTALLEERARAGKIICYIGMGVSLMNVVASSPFLERSGRE